MSTTNVQTEFSGMLGEVITVRKVNGRVVVANRPRRKRSAPSDKQQAVQEKFLEAAQYAKRQTAEAESRSMYSTGITDRKRTAFVVALSDYLKAPKVNFIDTISYDGSMGSTIIVKAVDDFMVTKVKVSIRDAAGALIEEGDAEPDILKVNLWEYHARVANPELAGTAIQAVAYDRPGNRGTAEIVL